MLSDFAAAELPPGWSLSVTPVGCGWQAEATAEDWPPLRVVTRERSDAANLAVKLVRRLHASAA